MLRIKEILKEKDVGVSELADRLGVSRQALSKQIQGKMLVETAIRIASALNVPIWELFASKEDIIGNDADNNETTLKCPHCGKPIAIKIAPIDAQE